MIPAIHSFRQDIADMMADFYEMFNYPFDREKALKNIHEFISDPGLGRLWLIRDGENIIGYAVLSFGFSFGYGGKDALLDELYFKKEFRGKGHGKKVMEFIIGEAKKLGLSGIHLEVEKKNHSAKELYAQFGFEPSDLEWHHKEIE